MTKLTDVYIKKFKTDKKEQWLSDDITKHLYFRFRQVDNKAFFYKYTQNKKANKIGLGSYPSLTLQKARVLANKYNEMLANGLDPKLQRVKEKASDDRLFHNVVTSFFKHQNNKWSQTHYRKMLGYYESDIKVVFGDRHIDTIELIEVANFIKRYGDTPTKQIKIKGLFKGIDDYALANGITTVAILHSSLSKIMTRETKKNLDHINPVKEKANLSRLLNDIDNYSKSVIVKTALQVAPYLAFRPSSIVTLLWSDIDFDNALIIVRAENMKLNREFRQPMSKQVVKLFRFIQKVTATNDYVFSNKKDTHITPDSLRVAIKKYLGYDGESDKPKFTTHGWRHTTATGLYYLQGKHGWKSEAIEMVLDHQEKNQVKAFYNKHDYLDVRREILQLWADYIDDIKINSNVIPVNF